MNRPPNLVYILADDWGYGDISCLNPEARVSTPQTDRLAAEGRVFRDAHSNSAVCTPTRYGVLTGRYCFRSRLKSGVLFGYDEPLLEPGRLTVAELLRQHGYATGCVGKWHLGLGWRRRSAEPEEIDYAAPLADGPHTRGFETSYIIPASLDMAPYVYIEDGRVVEPPTARIGASPRPAMWREGPIAPGFQHEHTLLELTGRAEAFVNEQARRGDRPFFLYFATPSPHTPHVPREPFRGTSRAGVYGDFVHEHDWSIGRILAALERNGLADETLVIVTSDNGAHQRGGGFDLEREYGHRSNYVFRGQKSDAWDGGHRIPFIARWPGYIPARTVCDQTICLTDLMATMAALLGVELPDDAGEDSVNLLPALLGDVAQPLREATVHHSLDGRFALRRGPWKYIECRGSGGWSLPEARVPDDAPPGQLYHLGDDPGEERNLYVHQPEVVAELRQLLERYQREPRSV